MLKTCGTENVLRNNIAQRIPLCCGSVCPTCSHVTSVSHTS